jgi:hypothetical protein
VFIRGLMGGFIGGFKALLEQAMAVPSSPVFLPGGWAMVRAIGGAEKFVVDADECCCQTSTTTPAGPPWGEGPCPSPAWCDWYCADTYYVTAATGQCSEAGPADCDGTYALERDDLACSGGSSCIWYGERPEGQFKCTACLVCALYAYPADYRWALTIAYTGNTAHCDWWKVIDDACPAGNYTLNTWYLPCDDCDETVTVYS